MTGITFHFLGDDFEREVPNTPVAAQETPAPKVEILHSGTRRLLFVNGVAVRQVLSVDTPRDQGGLAGVVNLSFVASEIVERKVSRESFEKLRHCATLPQILQGLHPGEAIIPLMPRALEKYSGYTVYETLGPGSGRVEMRAVVGFESGKGMVWVDAEAHGFKGADYGEWGVPIAPIQYDKIMVAHGQKCVLCMGSRKLPEPIK